MIHHYNLIYSIYLTTVKLENSHDYSIVTGNSIEVGK